MLPILKTKHILPDSFTYTTKGKFRFLWTYDIITQMMRVILKYGLKPHYKNQEIIQQLIKKHEESYFNTGKAIYYRMAIRGCTQAVLYTYPNMFITAIDSKKSLPCSIVNEFLDTNELLKQQFHGVNTTGALKIPKKETRIKTPKSIRDMLIPRTWCIDRIFQKILTGEYQWNFENPNKRWINNKNTKIISKKRKTSTTTELQELNKKFKNSNNSEDSEWIEEIDLIHSEEESNDNDVQSHNTSGTRQIIVENLQNESKSFPTKPKEIIILDSTEETNNNKPHAQELLDKNIKPTNASVINNKSCTQELLDRNIKPTNVSVNNNSKNSINNENIKSVNELINNNPIGLVNNSGHNNLVFHPPVNYQCLANNSGLQQQTHFVIQDTSKSDQIKLFLPTNTTLNSEINQFEWSKLNIQDQKSCIEESENISNQINSTNLKQLNKKQLLDMIDYMKKYETHLIQLLKAVIGNDRNKT